MCFIIVSICILIVLVMKVYSLIREQASSVCGRDCCSTRKAFMSMAGMMVKREIPATVSIIIAVSASR